MYVHVHYMNYFFIIQCTREIMLHDNDSNTFCDLLKLHKQQLVLSSKFVSLL